METVILMYYVGVIEGFVFFLSLVAVFSLITCVVFFAQQCDEEAKEKNRFKDYSNEELKALSENKTLLYTKEKNSYFKIIKISFIVFLVSSLLLVFLPKKNTVIDIAKTISDGTCVIKK